MSCTPEALQAELLETRRALMATRGELLKTQIVAATRLDVIRLLGFISNRQEIPDLSALLPAEAPVRAAFSAELRELSAGLRERARGYDVIAATLDAAAQETV